MIVHFEVDVIVRLLYKCFRRAGGSRPEKLKNGLYKLRHESFEGLESSILGLVEWDFGGSYANDMPCVFRVYFRGY